MTVVQFDRDALAQWYATQHLETDPGVESVYYLPGNSAEREIRLVEVNRLMGERTDGALEAIDFGVDRGTPLEHTLLVLDVTPDQWEQILEHRLRLPREWTLDGVRRLQ